MTIKSYMQLSGISYSFTFFVLFVISLTFAIIRNSMYIAILSASSLVWIFAVANYRIKISLFKSDDFLVDQFFIHIGIFSAIFSLVVIEQIFIMNILSMIIAIFHQKAVFYKNSELESLDSLEKKLKEPSKLGVDEQV